MNLMTKEKPYNTLNAFYRNKFGKKVFKVSLNGGFTCPNKDGKSGTGGCTFCSESGSGDYAGNKAEPLQVQFEKIKTRMHQKWKDAYYIAYFQANTNTYDTAENLRTLYEEALGLDPKIVGLSIGTRPDAFSEAIYDLLSELNTKTYLTVELGLQSIYPETSKLINRGHDLKCFDDAVKELRKRNIDVVVHVINGFPNENKEMMINTVKHVNTLGVQGIKIHMLHIVKKTVLGHQYTIKPFKTLSLEEYRDIVVDQIELLDPNIIIHRLTGDAPIETLIAPLWILKKFITVNEIDKVLRSTNSHQGIKYKTASL